MLKDQALRHTRSEVTISREEERVGTSSNQLRKELRWLGQSLFMIFLKRLN
jgi:hypothetical protein